MSCEGSLSLEGVYIVRGDGHWRGCELGEELVTGGGVSC